jgi:fatty-acyl-CoA synthase
MRNQGVGSWPARRARMSPDRTAIRYGESTSSYAEVAERATRLAHALAAQGVRGGDRVGYLGRNHPALAETLFACGLLGAVFVPLNTRLAVPELEFILDDAGVETLLWAPEFTHEIGELRAHSSRRHLALDTDYEPMLADASAESIDKAVALEDVCMIQYTSGTSGRPKGVMLSHANIAWNCYNLLLDVDVASDEISLVAAPMFHTAALNQLFLPTFLKGATALLVPAFDPREALRLITSERVTWMFGVPTMYLAMAQAPEWDDADLASIRVLMCGGAPVPEPLIRTYQQRGLTFVQGYGLTETSPGALFLRADDSTRKVGSAGTSCFFTDVRVVDPAGGDVAAGEIGEVLIEGPNVTAGYWQRPDDTAAAFVDGDWFRSGDAAVVDAEGFVTIVDRVKDMFISGGENVYPAEVEEALYAHPSVAECAVIGVADAHWGEVGRAVVVLRPGEAADGEDLLASLTGRLAKYKIPKSVVVVDALPRNATGKILKSRIRESFGAQ